MSALPSPGDNCTTQSRSRRGSSPIVCDETYRGPLAASEQETQNLVQYVAGTCTPDGACSGGIFADHRAGSMEPPGHIDDGDAAPDDTPGFFLDMHSNAALVLWPWGDTGTDSPNVNGLTTLGRRIAWFNSYTPEQSNELYLTDGTTDDSMYGLLGVASYTIETGAEFFEDCNSFEGFTAPHNLDALRYISRSLHAPYQLPAGPDTVDVEVSSDLVVPGDSITVTAHLDSQRFNQSNGSQTIYDIFSAGLYFDVLPWDTDAIQPMTAADGAFDSPVETAVATIDNIGGTGRHFVYVQASDSAANSGTPNAAFFDVADPSQIGTISGTVTDLASGDPMSATIALHNPANNEQHTAVSDPATGDYAAHAFPGSFDVTVSAPHHIAQDVEHDPGMLRIHYLMLLDLGLPENPALTVFHPQDPDRGASDPLVGEGGIGRNHVDEQHVSRAANRLNQAVSTGAKVAARLCSALAGANAPTKSGACSTNAATVIGMACHRRRA